MQDDYRVQLPIEDEGLARRLFDDVRHRRVVDVARRRLSDRVVVTHAEGMLFAYADSPELAAECARLLEELATERGEEAHATVARWHPEEEHWEAAEKPMPATPEQHAAEQARIDEVEDAGTPGWEVHVELPGHSETVALADRLTEEGHAVTRRWNHLFVAAAGSAEADELAARLDAELPDAEVHVEGGEAAAAAWRELHPFGFLGGLAN
jgi:hypothetical protein